MAFVGAQPHVWPTYGAGQALVRESESVGPGHWFINSQMEEMQRVRYGERAWGFPVHCEGALSLNLYVFTNQEAPESSPYLSLHTKCKHHLLCCSLPIYAFVRASRMFDYTYLLNHLSPFKRLCAP